MRLLRPLVLGLPAATLAWSLAAAQDLADSSILRDFDTVAFGNEFAEVDDPRIVKWNAPLRVYIDEDVPLDEAPRRMLSDHMQRLQRLTGIPIDYVKAAEEANYTIVFTQRTRYEDRVLGHVKEFGAGPMAAMMGRLGRSNCAGLYSVHGRTNAIERAVVIIPVDHAYERALLMRCIVEETTQTMGLPNDSDDVNPSVFNDRSILDDLTPHDELLVQLLYDTRLTPGMPRDEALQTAGRILPELRR